MKSFICLFIAFCYVNTLYSQSVDPGFIPSIYRKSTITNAAYGTDGDIYFTGLFSQVDNVPGGGLKRLNPNGTLDQGFDTGIGFDGQVNKVIPLSNGKVIVIGSFNYYKGTETGPMVVINTDGSIDSGFAMGAGFASISTKPVNNVIELPDQKLLVYGSFTSYNGFITNSIVKLNFDGTLDESLSVQDEIIQSVIHVAPQSTGKFVIDITRSDFQSAIITRLEADGTEDPTFTEFDHSFNQVYKIQAQSTDKVLMLAALPDIGDPFSVDFLRLNADGGIDDTFDLGSGVLGFFSDFKINDEDDIYIGSATAQTDDGGSVNGNLLGLISVLDADGTFQNSLASYEILQSSRVALGFNGEVAIYGKFLNVEGHETRGIASFNSNGTIDTDFTADIRSVSETHLIEVDDQNRVFVIARYSDDQDEPHHISRYTTSGSYDESFEAAFELQEVRLVKQLSDGRVAIGGGHIVFGGSTLPNFMILNEDGSIDEEFAENFGAGFNNNWVNDIEEDAEGNLYIAGSFTGFQGGTDGVAGIVKLDASGNRDLSFNSPFSTEILRINDIGLHDDGRVIVAGLYSTVGSNSFINGMALLNADGSFNSEFDRSTRVNAFIEKIEIVPDGYIVVGGFNRFNFFDFRNGLAKINSDGTINMEFNVDDALVSTKVYHSQLVGDALYLGGDISGYKGQDVNGIIKIDLDGNLDESFNMPASLSGTVLDFKVTSNGQIHLAGVLYDSNLSRRLAAARIGFGPDAAPTNLAVTDFDFESVSLSWQELSTNETSFTIERSAGDQENFEEIGSVAQDITSYKDEMVEGNTTYFYRVIGLKGTFPSEYSNVVEVRVPAAPPASPSDLNGVFISDNQIDLTWTDNADDEDNFTIERSVNDQVFQRLSTVSANETSYSDTDVDIAQKLIYRVLAMNDNGNSEVSNEFQIVIAGLFEGFPSQDTRFDFSLDQRTQQLSFELKNKQDQIREVNVLTSFGGHANHTENIQRSKFETSLVGNVKGIYVLQVLSNHGRFIVKFVLR